MIRIDLQGVPAVLQNIQRLQRPQTHVLGDALQAEGNRIMNESVRLVPVDTGLLRSTAAVSRPEERGPVVEVELRYGSHGTAPYAAKIEFDVTLNHPHGGQAHYLQMPLFQATAGFLERIAAPIRAALGAR
jgi:hypothetical protein